MTTTVGRLGRPSHRAALGAVVLAWLVAAPAPAAGQSSERPFRGLFGRLPGSSELRPQTLDFNASLYGGYDDDIFARGSGVRRPGTRIGGSFVGAQGRLGYARNSQTARFNASLSSAARWVEATEEVVPTFYGAYVSYGRSLSPRTSLNLTQRVAYRPYFSVVPFAAPSSLDDPIEDPETDPGLSLPGVDPGPDGPDDLTIGASRTGVMYSGTATLQRTLTPRSSLSFLAGYGLTDFGSQFDDVSNRRLRGAVRYSYGLTRYASLRLGYGYRTARTRTGTTNENHDIDVGVRYGRPFTFGRGRTTFSLTTGSAMAVRDRVNAEGDSGDRFVVRALGTATLRHDFTGPWQAQLVYIRSIAFLDGLSEPFAGDRVMASLGGWLGRRTDLNMSAGYVSGSVGLSRRNFNTALGTVRIRTALSSHVALFAQYHYYQYDFAPALADRLIVAPELERQGLRGGLTFWLPLAR